MKATILLGTLKKTGLSNTEVLCEFFQKHLEAQQIECSIIKLVEHSILPGTYNDMVKSLQGVGLGLTRLAECDVRWLTVKPPAPPEKKG